MRRLLPAMLFTNDRSFSVYSRGFLPNHHVSGTEQLTSAAPTQEDLLWEFTGQQVFDVPDTFLPDPDRILDPSEKPGDWLKLSTTGEKFISGRLPPVGRRAIRLQHVAASAIWKRGAGSLAP
jgi:hypothetical protein